MTEFRLGNDIEIGYDSDAYEKSYGRQWVPTDRDRVQFYSADDALEWRRTPADFEGQSWMRIYAHDIDDPVKIGAHRVVTDAQFLNPQVKDSVIPDDWKYEFLKYVGYPVYADVRHPNVTPGGNAAIYYVSAWIGQPTNNNLESFYLVDYNGNYITTGVSTITKNTADLPPHIYGVFNNNADTPTIPLTTQRANGTQLEDGRRGECNSFQIITNFGRVDTDTRTQVSNVLDINPDGTANKRELTATEAANFKGNIKTRTGFSVVPNNWDSKFRGIIANSEVFPSTKSTFNATGTLDAGIVDPSKHVLVIVLPERQAPFTETPQGVIIEQSVNGIFEIPFGSGRYYNLVGFSESDNSSVTLTFEVVAT